MSEGREFLRSRHLHIKAPNLKFPKPKQHERFGYNLGFGIKPWIAKYGAAWQGELAQAIVFGGRAEHGNLKIPNSPKMRKEAAEFLAHSRQLFKGGLLDTDRITRGGVVHHTLLEKAWEDTYRFVALHGNKKTGTPEALEQINALKESIAFAQDAKERRLLKHKLEEFKKATGVQAGKLEASKAGVKTYTADSSLKGKVAEVHSFLKDRNVLIAQQQIAKLEFKEETMWEKKYNGRNPGGAIGEGDDLKKERSDGIRLVRYLKRARWIKLSVWKGIMRPENTRLRAYLRKSLGARKFREFFLSANAQIKYATDAKFTPGSEYGYLKPSYNIKKGELTPLMKRRVFIMGKEKIRDIDD